MPMPVLKKSIVSTAVAAAALAGLVAFPAHADTPAAHRAQHQMAVTLDHVALKVISPDVPVGKPYVAAPGAGVQVASVSDLKPYQYLSVMAVPFGETLPQSVYPFPVSRAGDTAAWIRALHGAQNGPVATIFGQKVRGTIVHSHGDLTGKKSGRTDIEAVEWIVDAGGRTWVVNLQHDQAKLPAGFASGLTVASANPSARTSVDLAKLTAADQPATGRMHANDVALGGSLGLPSWWSSTCDGNGSQLSSSGTFMGLQVCGGGSSVIDSVPGVGQYEWQCADLSDRYLVQRYGVNGPGGNGNQEASNWYNAFPGKFDLHSNGDGTNTAPVPGDVLSFATGASAAGHTGVVYKSTVDTSGNGTVYFVDQNWTGDGGYNSASVSNWNVTEVTGEGGSVQWLHNPADSGGGSTSGPVYSGDIPVTGKWSSGVGHTQLGVFRPSATGANTFYLRQDNGATTSFTLGSPGDKPITGDWSGVGHTQLGVFRPSATGANTFYLRQDNGATTSFTLGSPGDKPITGDWAGVGHTQLGVFRVTGNTNTFYLRLDNGVVSSFTLGNVGDVPITGDWDGKGHAQIGVYRPSNGTYYLRHDDGTVTSTAFGNSTDIPVTGDWSGHGTTTIGLYRPSNANFYLDLAYVNSGTSNFLYGNGGTWS